MELSTLNSPFDCILFDLDDTLYSSNSGIQQICKQNIEQFLVKKCRVSVDQAAALRAELLKSYGSSLAGLLALGYDVHPDEYHSFVHWTLPYERIAADPQLRDLLRSIPQTKILFTNSDREHARWVMEKLGIGEDCFQGMVCFETLNPHLFDGEKKLSSSPPPEVILKPSFAAFEAAIRLAGTAPGRTLFLDDSEKNIATGKALGLCTALVGKRVMTKEADYLVESMATLKRAIPNIWGKPEKMMRSELDSIKPSTTVEV